LLLAAASVTYVTIEKGRLAAGSAQNVTYAQVAPILATHCASCHNVPAPPLGVRLNSWEHVKAAAARIRRVSVDSQAMPLGNATRMTPAEIVRQIRSQFPA
jgi:uncharacterized membrane protein